MLAAFGVPGALATPLAGGQGRSWLVEPAAGGLEAERLVVKPVHDAVEATEVAWLAEHLGGLTDDTGRGDGFRLAAPVLSTSGSWVAQGWSASTWVAGRPRPRGRWGELLSTAGAFHAAVGHLPRPAFLDQRTHRWARADRAAWDEQHLDLHPDVRVLGARLRAVVRAAPQGGHGPTQLVHGDLSGNVLFADHQAPAVIDVAPYWRPAAYAGAVVVADALLWEDQDDSLLTAAGPSGSVDLVARALLFRLLDHHEALREAGQLHSPRAPGLHPYRRAVSVVDDAALG